MPEVKTSKNQGLGLYASEKYEPGDIILEELPLFTFHPQNVEQLSSIQSQFKTSSLKNGVDSSFTKKKDVDAKTDSSVSLDDLNFLDVPSTIENCKRSKFKGLVTAAATYVISSNISTTTKEKLLSLYSPTISDDCDESNKYEEGIIKLVSAAISFLQENTIPSTPLHIFVHENRDECSKIMLIWACNAFKGGHVYEIMSRVNHSCDFNAIISLSTSSSKEGDGCDKQCVKASNVINPGDEIFISYLGTYTYAGMTLRKKMLSEDKYFDCQCSRCSNEEFKGDLASCIPCIQCHERLNGRYLDEDTQYDDDDENKVNYASPRGVGEDVKYFCEKCGDDKSYRLKSSLSTTIDKTIDRVIDHLDECAGVNVHNNTDETTNEEMAEMTERLLCLSYSVLGSKHYCTNLLLVQSLAKKLSDIHASMLCSSVGKNDNKKGSNKDVNKETGLGVDITDVAECIDLLERCFTYTHSLDLNSHVGHLLGSVTIGVARVLVGFGKINYPILNHD